MSKPNPKGSSRKQPFLAALTDSLATQNELIDSLTAHISLYHSHSSASPNPNSNPSPPRSSILKWFASLTVHQRQAHLTVVDHRFTQLLIQMLGKLRTNGHGRFIILPDLPSGDLPGLCYKKSRGLLCRSAESNDSERLIIESTRLFWSREGEKIEECSCSAKCLDSVTVSEDFVENLDKFVETMDNVSNGAFLKGEVGELGSDWVELEWLKATGYYSIEAFVANRLEVAMRLAWLNCCSGKKRGIKLKEKVAAPGVAANVFWRKKGCIDWWENLGAEMRRRILVVVLGKAAKSLTHEVLKGASSALEDERWLFRARGEQKWRDIYAGPLAKSGLSLFSDAEFGSIIMPASSSRIDAFVANVFNPLMVLQNFFPLIPLGQDREYNVSKIFFSSLGSINTISDCILRKLRGFFMVISLDCMKLELFGEGTSKPSNKPKNKLGAGSHRKKGKTHGMKKLASEPQTCVGMSSFENPPKDLGCTLPCHEIHTVGCHGMAEIPLAKDEHGALLSPMEHSKGLVLGKGRNAARRNRKGRSKNKIFGKLAEERNFPMSVVEAPCFSVISSDEVAKQGGISDKLTGQNVSNDNVIDVVKHASNASLSSSGDEPTRKEISADHAVGSTEGLCHVVPAPELDDVSSNVDANIRTGKLEATAGSAHKSVGNLGINGESTRFQGQLNGNLYDSGSTSPLECLSYEWPVLAPFYFPSTNSHIPTATDRLHLDVGHNWHNHTRQPFVSSVLQARNSPIESSCNRMLPRPLPMSLDWPPMVRSVRGFTPSMTCNYDSRFISRRQSTFQKNFTAQNMQFNAKTIDDDRKNSGEFMDFPESMNGLELAEECDSNWMSEEELEVHTVPGIDYNQYFGGGVMYWNSSDYPGTGFSRPPSISSDDSSWAWREADMNRAVDDMVAFSSSYSTNGLTSPTAATFCSPFDPLGPGHQTLGYAVPGNEAPGKVLHSSSTVKDTVTEEVSVSLGSLPVDIEGKTGESLPYPILRPIIISKEVPRSDIKHNPPHKSPCVPPMRREQAQIKRPPSPVVLCVPRAPRPPPPSPASDTRKRRGFPTVRSGSSSPRNWGMRGWYQDGTNLEEACVRMDGTEVIWPSWRNKNLSACPMIQPLSGALLQDHLIAMSQLARDQEHPDVSFPLLPPDLQSCPKRKPSISLMHSLLHDEIDLFYKKVASANMAHKPFINWAVKRVTRSLQVLWPRSRTNIYGSNATGLSLPTSDVDLVVCLPPVRNLEPIKEAGILEGRNGIKETCLQHAARYLANQEWVKNDSLKTVENTAVPIIMLVVEVPNDLNIPASSNTQSPKEEAANITAEEDNNIQSDMAGLEDSVSPKFAQSDNDSTKDVKSVRLDISFKSASHTGLQTTELVKGLTEQFPAATPLALVLKQFLADRSLDQSYSGGLSSYCLVLLIIRFLQHEHHLGRPINQNLGTLLMDFLYFFGNVFDPRQMRISVQGSGVYLKRERGYSIDPIHIDDPLFPTNNVGRNCFRIHQCIKAFSDAYSVLENELICLPDEGDKCSRGSYSLLQKIIPNLGQGV